jgi:hypothetical protein
MITGIGDERGLPPSKRSTRLVYGKLTTMGQADWPVRRSARSPHRLITVTRTSRLCWRRQPHGVSSGPATCAERVAVAAGPA